MADISQTIFSDAFPWMESFVFFIKISLKFVPKGPIDNNASLVWIMACRLFGAKPLSEPMLARFTDTYASLGRDKLTHWGRVTHICVSELTIIGSDNGLSPGRRQAIIWTNARILLIGPLGTNFNDILIEIHIISFKKIHLKMSSGNGGHFVSASMC